MSARVRFPHLIAASVLLVCCAPVLAIVIVQMIFGAAP